MKYLQNIVKLKIFTYNDFVGIVGNKNLAKVTLKNYINKGYVVRIKHNLYSPISFETNEMLADKFLIGSSLSETAFISHHSAFEFYGYYNQIYDVVNVSSKTLIRNFSFEQNEYIVIKTNFNQYVEKVRGIKVSSIERTIIDCIKDCNKYTDLEETLNCIQLIPYIDIDAILNYLEIINSKMLYKKVGYILSLFKEQFNIPDSFFIKCHDVSDSVKGYFDSNKKAFVYDSKWKAFVYKDLSNYINKE